METIEITGESNATILPIHAFSSWRFRHFRMFFRVFFSGTFFTLLSLRIQSEQIHLRMFWSPFHRIVCFFVICIERNVVEVNGVTVNLDVIGKDAELEMNNNNNNEDLVTKKGSMTHEEPQVVQAESEKVMGDEMAKETENDESKPTEPEMGSLTDNGNANNVQSEPTDADLEVKHATESEASDEKTEGDEKSESVEKTEAEPTTQTEASESKESTEPSESTSQTIVSEKDEAHIEPESGTSEIVIENAIEKDTEKAIETPQEKEVVPSEQSGDDATQNEAKTEEENGTVSAAEQKDDAQTESEQKDDGADETVKSDSPKRSPRKKSSNKKRKNRTRSQKKQDYSDLVKYTVSTSQRQRRYMLHVPRGRVIDVPGDDCEIFCSNIPINVLEGELIPLFERYGKIWELRLMMSMRNPKRNAGFAFVRYTTSEAAKEATEKLNNYEILPGKLLAIRLSQPNLSLFVGNIHRSLTREQIHEKISNRTEGKRFAFFRFFFENFLSFFLTFFFLFQLKVFQTK